MNSIGRWSLGAAMLVAAAVSLAACASDGGQPAEQSVAQPAEQPTASVAQVEQQDEPAASYEAGESESSDEEASSQPAGESTSDSMDSQPAVEDAPEEAMVGAILQTGHRAGLFADRNSVGDPDAPIVITDYSDFL